MITVDVLVNSIMHTQQYPPPSETEMKVVNHLKRGYNCRDLSWIHGDLLIPQEMKSNDTE